MFYNFILTEHGITHYHFFRENIYLGVQVTIPTTHILFTNHLEVPKCKEVILCILHSRFAKKPCVSGWICYASQVLSNFISMLLTLSETVRIAFILCVRKDKYILLPIVTTRELRFTNFAQLVVLLHNITSWRLWSHILIFFEV